MSDPASPVVTRIAPSPTGMMHIGTARTALFNWLYARHTGGKFLIRIEDTDRERSTPDAVQAIFDGMAWLGLEPDAEPIFQHARAERHREAALELLERGGAYRCYMTVEELAAERETARAEGRPIRSPWRDREPLARREPAVRGPAARAARGRDGGRTTWSRAPSCSATANWTTSSCCAPTARRPTTWPWWSTTTTWAITHVIRGDDHLSNTAAPDR